MVKHIVLFKLKETLSPAEKTDIMNRFKAAIEALPATIPFIRDIHVGLNENPAEVWDICLDSSFDTLDDVKAYAIHPAHVAAAGILKEAPAWTILSKTQPSWKKSSIHGKEWKDTSVSAVRPTTSRA